jgi:DNA topoisomerase-1
VVKEGKALRPTNLGEAVTDLMIDKFTDIVDVGFTSDMEEQLDEVETGKTDYVALLHKFYGEFSGKLQQAETDLDKKRIKVKDEESEEVCEKCGRKMVIKTSRFGKFLACPGYPECKNTKPITEDTGVACPVCGGRLLKKKSKSGYAYYGCEKNPTCEFMTWDKPTNKKCPKCGGVIYRHYTKEDKRNLCHVPGCGYEEAIVTRSKKAAAEGEEAPAKKTTRKTAKKAETAETKTTAKKTAKKAETAEKKTAAKKTTKKAEAGEKKTAAKKTTKKSETAEKKTAAKKTTTRKTVKKGEETDA